jgi:hypothetical protein
VSDSSRSTSGSGGPAFPVVTREPETGHQAGESVWQYPGMLLRDYLAAKAMQGDLASQSDAHPLQPKHFELMAQRWYSIADAMLKAREQQA